MKVRCGILIPYVALATLVGCAATGQPERKPLFFPQQDESDTLDFCNIRPESQPLYVQVLGSSSTLTDSTYTLFLQVGIYRRAGFANWRLKLYPDSVTLTIGDLHPVRRLNIGTDRPAAGPWQASSAHFFVFDRDVLEGRFPDVRWLEGEVSFPGYISYAGHPVAVNSIRVIDPWYRSRAREWDQE